MCGLCVVLFAFGPSSGTAMLFSLSLVFLKNANLFLTASSQHSFHWINANTHTHFCSSNFKHTDTRAQKCLCFSSFSSPWLAPLSSPLGLSRGSPEGSRYTETGFVIVSLNCEDEWLTGGFCQLNPSSAAWGEQQANHWTALQPAGLFSGSATSPNCERVSPLTHSSSIQQRGDNCVTGLPSR